MNMLRRGLLAAYLTTAACSGDDIIADDELEFDAAVPPDAPAPRPDADPCAPIETVAFGTLTRCPIDAGVPDPPPLDAPPEAPPPRDAAVVCDAPPADPPPDPPPRECDASVPDAEPDAAPECDDPP